MDAPDADPRFFVAASTVPGAGRGLFARAPLSPGDRLDVVGVLVVPGSLADDCTRFADAHKFRAGDRLLIPLGLAALVNHSADRPNLDKVVTGREVCLRVTRPVAAGEELFFRYDDYAVQRFGLSGPVGSGG